MRALQLDWTAISQQLEAPNGSRVGSLHQEVQLTAGVFQTRRALQFRWLPSAETGSVLGKKIEGLFWRAEQRLFREETMTPGAAQQGTD